MRRGSPLLDGCTLRQKRQAPSISAGPGRKSSSPMIPRTSHNARRARTGSPGGARCSRPPTMGDIKSGPPFGHTAPERCATRQSCTREHDATVEAAPLRAASPSRFLDRDPVAPGLAATAPAAVDLCYGRRRSPRSPSLRRSPCRPSREERASFTRPGVVPPAIAPVRCEEETRPVSSAAPAPISSGDIRALLP
jgi:hypothetical protein